MGLMISMDTKSVDLAARKALGKRHLEANRLEEAIQVYAQILREDPSDVESYLFLGDCYLADGDANTALAFYEQAQSLAPEDTQVRRRIHLAQVEASSPWQKEASALPKNLPSSPAVPTHPQAVADIIKELTHRTPVITEEEVLKAAKLLEEIIHSPHPALRVAERLDEINELIPALLELNIRQARADGRDDLVIGLENLLQNITLQKEAQEEGKTNAKGTPSSVEVTPRTVKALFLDPAQAIPMLKSNFPQEELTKLDCQFLYQAEDANLQDCDVVIARHPHVDVKSMELLAAAHAAKKPILVFLEADFEQMPLTHPAYEGIGLNSPARARAYSAACLLADRICVPSETFANTLRQSGYPVTVIPPGWSSEDESRSKPVQPRHTLNLGWLGYGGELEDVFQVKRMIVRALREFPHVRLIIGGDVEVYQLFDNLPEARRVFYPILQEEDYLYALRQMDVLLVPLRNTPYNRSLTDQRVLEAGGRGIPWVASPLPAIVNWGGGGLMANSLDEWHTYIRQLIMDAELRVSLGNTGRQQAELRSARFQAKCWLQAILQTMGA